MKLDDCRYDGSKKFDLSKYPTSAKMSKKLKPEYAELTAANTARMAELQEKLYADGREGVVIMLQAMDAAGKDSTIKHVMSGVNPQGCSVYSFKTPSKEELAHNYLWRAIKNLPERGNIAIFNRSYYEDVLVVRVRNLRETYAMPDRFFEGSDDEFFDARYRQIREFEEFLYENGYRLLKIFLHVGLDEQRDRLLARIDEPAKNWKFSSSDLAERELWPEYMDAFEKCIGGTSSKHAPWYVIPADQKWYARWLASEAVVKVLEDCDPQFPTLSDEERAKMAECRERLINWPSE
ncbi:MAG: polyphosphate kinase 2 family protein [Eggerthellaceae bacterium]|nr:polyphosphate kinase 2 family protein [Eggerthellaceae bacterium]